MTSRDHMISRDDSTYWRRVLSHTLEQDVESHPVGSPQKQWLRASSFYRYCQREEVICALTKTVRKDTTNADLSLTFKHGTALHTLLQDEILPDALGLRGIWKCNKCGHQVGGHSKEDWAWIKSRRKSGIHTPEDAVRLTALSTSQAATLVKRPASCPSCGAKPHPQKKPVWKFKERWYADVEHGLGGSCDGLIESPLMDGPGLLEAKSIGGGQAWKIQTAPLPHHLIQATIYMWLTGTQWAQVLYWDKGEHGLKALTFHTVTRDEAFVDQIKTVCREIWDGIKTRTLPERGVCRTQACPRARSCAVSSLCFRRSLASRG